MIVIIKRCAPKQKIDEFISDITKQGLKVKDISGEMTTAYGIIGDTSKLDIDIVKSYEVVEAVQRVSEPFKNANRKFHAEDSVIDVSGFKIGGGHFQVIAGPCSVESEEQIISVAKSVKEAGATMLRGGAFKPRTSPYSFQGLGPEGIKLLLAAKKETGLPIVTEIMDLSHLKYFDEVDVIQVGARNMQNFALLKELGTLKKPVLLKRGLANTIEEWLMSAEYIMAGGNNNVILCERGIRTFETYMRNTLDIAAVPLVKKLSHLPVIVDPSHASGISYLVPPLSKAAVSAGADALMIEVHNNPEKALSDGPQSLNPESFRELMKEIKKLICLEGKILGKKEK